MTSNLDMEAISLQALREIANCHVLEWLNDPDQEGLRDQVIHVHKLFPQSPIARSARFVRMKAIVAATPEGGFALEPGSRLGLLCRFLEAATALVDWESVVNQLLRNHIEGGK